MPSTEKEFDKEKDQELLFFNFKEDGNSFSSDVPDLGHRTFLDFLAEVVMLMIFAITAIFMFESSEINQPIDYEYELYSQSNYPHVIKSNYNLDGTITKQYSNGVVVDFNKDGSYTAKLGSSENNVSYQNHP